MNSAVQLRTEDLRILENSREILELAVLSGSILILLGDESTVGPRLSEILAGRSVPFSGSILVGPEQTDIQSSQSRALIGYLDSRFSCPEGITVERCLSMGCAAAGFSRKETREILQQLLGWCSLQDCKDMEVSRLDPARRFITGFAAACLPVPGVLVMKGILPPEVYPLMEDLCETGCSVIASVPGIESIPISAERVAICDETDVARIVRQSELAEAVSELMRIRVAFYPPLPRAVMESLSGARDITAVKGGFEFHHSNLSTAVTNLANLARANSRQISRMEVLAPSAADLSDVLRIEEDESEADLFAEG